MVLHKVNEEVGVWKPLNAVSTCKPLKVYDHDSDMIKVVFRESSGDSLEEDKTEDGSTTQGANTVTKGGPEGVGYCFKLTSIKCLLCARHCSTCLDTSVNQSGKLYLKR